MSTETERTELTELDLITRREALRRVSALLGGVALVGSTAWLTGCKNDKPAPGGAAGGGAGADFTPEEVALLDEIADTILPETSTPGAKAVQTGAFMALMVKDTYDEKNTRIFRDGMRKVDEAARAAHDVSFVQATPPQRLAILEQLDREQKTYMDQREAARNEKEEERKADSYLPDQRSESGTGASDANPAPEITNPVEEKKDDDDPGSHYFRLMKELALLGYFTSEIGYTKAMRYTESPGRFDPCVPYQKGEKIWAPHA